MVPHVASLVSTWNLCATHGAYLMLAWHKLINREVRVNGALMGQFIMVYVVFCLNILNSILFFTWGYSHFVSFASDVEMCGVSDQEA